MWSTLHCSIWILGFGNLKSTEFLEAQLRFSPRGYCCRSHRYWSCLQHEPQTLSLNAHVVKEERAGTLNGFQGFKIFYLLTMKVKVFFVLNFLRGAICTFGEYVLIRTIVDWSFKCLNKLNKQTVCFHDWINKLTLKDNTISYCFTLFIGGGPCLLFSFKQCSGDLIFLW